MAPPPHIIATPRWLLSLRYTQITLAIIILGISSYGLYWLELSVCSYPSSSRRETCKTDTLSHRPGALHSSWQAVHANFPTLQ
jgi:hypothetical protein